jgi:uncharacterized protein YbgA (DUF1722 family)/uncharacterized protein YbbK (DUF523 family)
LLLKEDENTPVKPLRLGISSCLLGNRVRYDGGHKLDCFISGTLGRYLELVPVCPEVECGMAVPREAMRLEGNPDQPRLLTVHSRIDHSDRMLAWVRQRLSQLEDEALCGFILKSGSPSCGMNGVTVQGENGEPVRRGAGLFARELLRHFSVLPVEDEQRLHDPELRDNFLERLFVYARWRELLLAKRSKGGLVDFHSRHKLLVMAHSPKHYRELGKLVAQAGGYEEKELFARYELLFMAGLRLPATPRKNANVLQHLMGYFKKQLPGAEKEELLELIDRHRLGLLPLIVPITLINHYVAKLGEPYLARQWYLRPGSLELRLRYHA